jgi:hypothetical protein
MGRERQRRHKGKKWKRVGKKAVPKREKRGRNRQRKIRRQAVR